MTATSCSPALQQVAAGYRIYGPQTTLVLTVGDGVSMFTLDREQGSFVLIEENVKIPEDTKEFAINMSNMRHWDAPVKRYVDECLAGADGPRGKNFNMRWVAAMVADVHRILCRGGIFMYPWDKREPQKAGKLRLMYEANPMSLAGRTGRRHGYQRPPAHPRHPAHTTARACERRPRLQERSGTRDRLPP